MYFKEDYLMTRAERQKEWERRVNQYRVSGESVKQWCAHNNVKADRLWYWLRKYKINKDTPCIQSNQWLPVKVCDDSTADRDNFLIIRVGEAQIEVKEGFDPILLSQVVRTLVASC